MSQRSDVAPSTLDVDIDGDTIRVEYLDGRAVTYRAPSEATAGPIRCQPEKEVHILLVDPSAGDGVMVYVNDRRTHEDILDSTGVGRVMLTPGEAATVLPGVRVEMDGYAPVVDADQAQGERVFVFEEDEVGERAYEIAE